MAISAQRDLVSCMKTETYLNVSIVSKLQPLPSDLKQIFNKDALEKLTQNVFNPLSYYLVSIVDPGKASSFSWPLYDTKTERAYRNELSSFIADYSGKGLLSPVMSSYLVNPACYKVTLFMFQLSQLAVQCILKFMMKRDHQKKKYDEITEKYKSQNDGFVDAIEKENELVMLKFSNYVEKRKKYEKIAELFRNGIISMDDKLKKLKVKDKVVKLVDSFEMDNTIDEVTKNSILEIKNFNKPAQYFNQWLEDIDSKLDSLEKEWNTRMSPIVNSASKTMELTKQLIDRQTGEADKNTFIVEYDPNAEICTKVLYEKVNSQQKYILKNIVKDDRLSFPNLIKGYLVAISYAFKNRQIGNEIYQFNEYLQQSNKSYLEMVEAMRTLTERLRNAEARLEPSSLSLDQSISIKDITEIPPLPDLSDLSMKRDVHTYFEFTPLGANKHQFYLRRTNTTSFLKPQNRSMIYQAPRDDFFKNFISGHVSYDRSSTSNVNNMSIISQIHGQSNETIADCASGFTKQQIQRLLSTNKKSSSTKKHKFKLDRPSMLIKKGGLFNVSSSKANVSNTSSENGLFRCHSSPNLFENKEARHIKRSRKLSIMQEGSLSLLEVSGIMAIDKDTPDHAHLQPISIESPSFPIPTLIITPAKANVRDNLVKDIGNNSIESGIASMCSKKSLDHETETPKSKIPVPVKQASSIEKIINRFKKVKANVIAQEAKEIEIRTIVEEKENFNAVNVDVFTANKVLLPDLLSPSCSMLSMKAGDFLDQICDDGDTNEVRKPRESLGTALGVDNTFLDQFDLVD